MCCTGGVGFCFPIVFLHLKRKPRFIYKGHKIIIPFLRREHVGPALRYGLSLLFVFRLYFLFPCVRRTCFPLASRARQIVKEKEIILPSFCFSLILAIENTLSFRGASTLWGAPFSELCVFQFLALVKYSEKLAKRLETLRFKPFCCLLLTKKMQLHAIYKDDIFCVKL